MASLFAAHPGGIAFQRHEEPTRGETDIPSDQNQMQAHICLCALAYHLLVPMEKTLRDKGIYESFETVRDMLSSH